MSKNTVLKRNTARVSAMLTGLAIAATMAGFTISGAASAAPAPVQNETSTAAGEYTAQAKFFGSFRTSTLCVEKARWVELNGTAVTDAWCVQGNAMGTIWHLYYEGRL
ncbi:hypothetical protein [Glycomyces sp. NPDC047010]|uniref:hypothetical protein n=1 Tax=Glycomyces sp. NPDC047010 TaxID=3155023 RepID=UPI0033D27533